MTLAWWMRAVGVFYLLLFVLVSIVHLPIEAEGPRGTLAQAAAGDPLARFVVDTWVTLGLQFGVLGAALLIASRRPREAVVLVWTVIALELVWGIGIDIYKIGRGYEATGRMIWVVIHSVIAVTGIVALRRQRA